MANPFRIGKLKKFDPSNAETLPSDSELTEHALMKAPSEDTPETPSATSPRKARFKRLLGIMKK